jgi:hypothetical protein
MKKIKESLTTKKVVDLSERRLQGMSEDELLSHIVERMVDHINLLVTVTSDLSNRIAVFEEHPSASSVPLLSYEEDL